MRLKVLNASIGHVDAAVNGEWGNWMEWARQHRMWRFPWQDTSRKRAHGTPPESRSGYFQPRGAARHVLLLGKESILGCLEPQCRRRARSFSPTHTPQPCSPTTKPFASLHTQVTQKYRLKSTPYISAMMLEPGHDAHQRIVVRKF